MYVLPELSLLGAAETGGWVVKYPTSLVNLLTFIPVARRDSVMAPLGIVADMDGVLSL